MRAELMTPFLSGRSQPLSRVTIAGSEDLNYVVDYSVADPYTAADIAPQCRCNSNTAAGTLTVDDGFVSRPPLSDVGHFEAFTYGKQLLAENQQVAGPLTGDEDWIDAGLISISVLYEENGFIYSIHVDNAD